MLGHLQNEPGVPALHFQGVEDGGQPFIELDVHHGTDDRHDAPGGGARLRGGRCLGGIVSG